MRKARLPSAKCFHWFYLKQNPLEKQLLTKQLLNKKNSAWRHTLLTHLGVVSVASLHENVLAFWHNFH